MTLADELDGIAAAAAAHAGEGEQVAAVLATETHGARVYLCAFSRDGDVPESWVALDAAGAVVTERRLLRDAISIAAMCELAEETAAGGDLDELRGQLVALRVTENPPGIEDAEAAVLELQRVLGAPPQLATTARLDTIGRATRELELALGGALQGSPFVEAMKAAPAVVERLTADVEGSYKGVLS